MKKKFIVDCEKCGKKFRVEETGNNWPGGLEREEACCPYCGEVAYSTMTSGFIYVYKIDETDESK